jgi:hypothetical protein
MKDSIGFRIPITALIHEYRSMAIIMPVGLIVPWFLGLVTVSTVIQTFFIVAFIFGCSFWYTLNYKWVYLSMEGIQGESPWGVNVFIPWTAKVTLSSGAAFGGMKCISIQNKDQKPALMLPVAISETPEFIEALKMVAPSEHPLLSARDHLKTN